MLLKSAATYGPPPTGTTKMTTLSSLPKILHVIDNDKCQEAQQKPNSINNDDDFRCVDHFLTEKWRSNRTTETAISSPYRSNISSASSTLSNYSSSDQETNSDDVSPVSLSHHDVLSPDSPDSGVSGSVNSIDEKCGDEELDFFYSDPNVEYLRLDRIGLEEHDSLFNLNGLDKIHEFKAPIGPIIDEHIETNKSAEETADKQNDAFGGKDTVLPPPPPPEQTIISPSPVTVEDHKELPEQTVEDDYEKLLLDKQIEAVVQNIPKGFDYLVRMFIQDPENETDSDPYNDSVEDPDRPSTSSFSYNNESFIKTPDLTMSPLDTYSNPVKTDLSTSFDWSIKTRTNGASDMQEMLKQLKLNARNIKINNASKKQTFCCQWHDCDWPGNYEDLAEHLREIHVELQPFMDANGKVIKWNKQNDKSASNSSKEDESNNDDASSQTTLEDIDTEDEDSSTEDDTRSSQFSLPSATRRSRRLQDPNNPFEMYRSSKKTPMGGDKAEKFVCLWRGCKVFGKPSLSRHWIERHVLEQHSGPKPFKCIVDGCGQRFRTQNQLEKHVNMHFKSSNQSMADLQISMMNKSKISLISDPKTLNMSCCKCSCHSFNPNNCDMSTSTGDDPSPKNRMDKSSRSQSVDSGISVQYGTEIFPSPSLTSLSTKQQPEHCHTSCCCLSKSSIDGKSSKISKINKKKPSSVTRTTVKGVGNVDFLDDECALKLEYEIKAQDALLSNLKSCLPYDQCVRYPATDNDPAGIYNVFQKKLFTLNRIESVPFESDVIACKSRSNDEFFYTLRWHPRGVLNNESVPEEKLETKRTCLLNYSQLRNHVQKSFDVIFPPNKSDKSGSRRNSRQVFSESKTMECSFEGGSGLKRKSNMESIAQLKRKRLA